jgi:hypothetical protein
MTRLPGHEPLRVDLPKPPWWIVAAGLIGFLIYIAFVALCFAALALGVWWLYGQVIN